MEQEEFFLLSYNPNNVELCVTAVGIYDAQKLKKGEYNPDHLKVEKSQGRKAYDFVRLQDIFNCLISERLVKAFEAAGLSGWQTYAIEADSTLQGYKGFQCTGKCGPPVRPEKSGFVIGYEFDVKTWDGSDFFIPESTLMVICTGKAKEVIDGFKIKNVKLESLKSLEWYSA